MHLEFIGPPGAGKSSIHRGLTSRPEWYGGTHADAVGRRFVAEARPHRRALYRTLPTAVRSWVDNMVLDQRLRKNAFREFLVASPEFASVLGELLPQTDRPEVSCWYCQNAAETYQLGRTTVTDSEEFVMDEGFCHRMSLVLWRAQSGVADATLARYLDVVPLPDVLVWVDAPYETCLRRQEGRGRTPINEHWKSDPAAAHTAFLEAANRVRERVIDREETAVVRVNSTAPLKPVIERVHQQVSSLVESSFSGGEAAVRRSPVE
jgi:hypothetical protein